MKSVTFSLSSSRKVAVLNKLKLYGLTFPLLLSAPFVRADFIDLLGTFSNNLEEKSAEAALRTYERLIEEQGCTDRSTGLDSTACVGRVFDVFDNVREIIHTGNEISGTGSTLFSLRTDQQELGSALRWLAAEEYAAQGDMASDFVSDQVAGLGSRLSALRFGARGFQFAQNGVWLPQGEYALQNGTHGGAAGSEDNYSKLGGFLNVQGSIGSRDPSGRENAFDSDGTTLNTGLDYRLNNQWTLGAMLGYTTQQIDFDSSQSIVDGDIESSGFNFMPFVLYQSGNYYFSASLAYQQLDFDSRRAIRYPSNNINIASTNTETIAETQAKIVSAFAEMGYSYVWEKFSVEPFFNIQSSSIVIDEFIEDDINDDAFDLVIKEQDFSTLNYSFGLKTQYTFTPRSGVFVPYLSVEHVAQTDTESRDVEAYHSGLGSDDTLYFIPTEELDDSYQTITVGMSSVLRGGRELRDGGTVGGDIQGFFNIKQITGLDGYDLMFYSLGLRYAF